VSSEQHQASAAAPAQRGSRFRAAFTVIRDVAMTGLALYGIWHQEISAKPQPWLLLAYVVMLGIIPASHAWALARAAVPMLQPGPGSPPPSSTPGPDTATASPPP
jgi:hypothetical protein